ncbi:thiamine diphosphate-binding protein [Cladochytrium replicatum]|nr:thiamine diphosphate-binding protein [Cladochytrium replicatum]
MLAALAARRSAWNCPVRIRSPPQFLAAAMTGRLSPTRCYHYDSTVFGFRQPRTYTMPDYTPEEIENRKENANLLRFVQAYRYHGHNACDLDPLNLTPKKEIPALQPGRFGLPESGGRYNLTGVLHVGEKNDRYVSRREASIEMIIEHLKNTYTSRIGFEFEHIPNISERRWFRYYLESFERRSFSSDEKKRMFELLAKSEVFDQFMTKKFPQVKRYGLEGAESMMVMLDTIFKEANQTGIQELVLCMPHRGRLNVLVDLLKYPLDKLFHKIKGNNEFPDDEPAMGDVLSHLATSADLSYGVKGPINVNMLHNPSHLEAINPVAVGKARARQMYLYDSGAAGPECQLGDRVLCVQLHGDAAFCGQGVVTETLGLSNLPHYTAGGSIHLIVNNQIGYTTPAMNSRSSLYSSDVGKMIGCPVIHVNADYPEDVAYAATIASEYRNKFRKDVIVDLIAYRRWGHNELDEPAFTQPLMYKNIRSRTSVPKTYENTLVTSSLLSADETAKFRDTHMLQLEDGLKRSYEYTPLPTVLKGDWEGFIIPKTAVTRVDTGADTKLLREIGRQSVALPEGFTPHPRLKKYHIEPRVAKLKDDLPDDASALDWATAEALAFASLLNEGFHVRISGQDVGRGTFSQRHIMVVDQQTEQTVIPLNHLDIPREKVSSSPSYTTFPHFPAPEPAFKNPAQPQKRGMLEIANSSLSEFAVMGFEYGVSLDNPNRLVIWEAQFGDFFNGAQIILDVFVSSGETKWLTESGLVVLLPHGYDGAGPEHSSARIERFLQMCDQKYDVRSEAIPDNPNMHVVNPTTPAQYFHVLRRQMHRNFRKPLIIAGPKILLRHPSAVSPLSAFAPGTTFEPLLPDPTPHIPANAHGPARVIFVSGKLFYELDAHRKKSPPPFPVAIVRVEELHPFPTDLVERELERLGKEVFGQYGGIGSVKWVQEEPQNMGAWSFVAQRLEALLPEGTKLEYVGRVPSAAPATGVSSRHKVEQAKLIQVAFA